MSLNPTQLQHQTDALRRDVSFLHQFEIEASDVRTRSEVVQRELTEDGVSLPVYVKVYSYKKHPFQRLWRKGTAHNEARNLLFFRAIGISSPRVIAWGERKNAIGKIVEDFIITEAVSDTLPLYELIPTACPDRSTPTYCKRRDSILDQLGRWTSAMHAYQFYHQDLKWRNILGRVNGANIELFWIDCPKGNFNSLPFQQTRGRLKDCATLDKLAHLHCSKEERLCFVAAYLKQPIDTAAVAAFSSAIAHYRRKRFDAEDDRQARQRLAQANAATKK